MKIKTSIGITVEQPKTSCTDKKCPFHGSLKIRGRIFKGTVVSTDVHRSATVSWEWKRLIPKFERFERRRTKIRAHNPACINAVVGQFVTIAECRPISKTKNFVIIEKHGADVRYKEKQDSIEQDRQPKKAEQGKAKPQGEQE